MRIKINFTFTLYKYTQKNKCKYFNMIKQNKNNFRQKTLYDQNKFLYLSRYITIKLYN